MRIKHSENSGVKKNSFLVILFALVLTVSFSQEIKVMSYNIRFDNPDDNLDSWAHRKDFLIAQVAYFAPDVIGTQEGLIHQLDDMEKGLASYSFVGVGRDTGTREGEHTAIFYNKEILTVEEEGTFWLSETPDQPSKAWDAALNRICTFARFKERESDRSFYVFNTHFDHVGVVARSKSADLILKKIKELNPEGLPVVLTGDLNLEPVEKPILQILEVLNDAFTLSEENHFGPEGTFNGFKIDVPAERRIDYVFISQDDFTVLKHAILSESKKAHFPSDHFPVLAHLKFK